MNTLFLDTHSDNVVIAIYKDGNTLTYENIPSKGEQCTVVMPAIERILASIELTINDINDIIVVNGPGSFTGVRIGVTIAKTLAFVLNVPIRTISCLEVYAISNKKGYGKLIAVRDPKGYYYMMFNQNNELMWDYNYLSIDKFNGFIEQKNLDRMLIKENFNYDVDIICNYAHLRPAINPHEVNPLYVKSIEVENGTNS